MGQSGIGSKIIKKCSKRIPLWTFVYLFFLLYIIKYFYTIRERGHIGIGSKIKKNVIKRIS